MNAECQTNKLQNVMGVTTCAARWGRGRSESPEGMKISLAMQQNQGKPEVSSRHMEACRIEVNDVRVCVDPRGKERTELALTRIFTFASDPLTCLLRQLS